MLAHRLGPTIPPFRSVIVVDAPIDRVWAVLANVEEQPRWMREMRAVRLIDPLPVRVGTRAIATVRIAGITVEDPVEITAFESPTRFAIRHDGTFSGGGVITLDAGGDGTTTIVRWDETLVAPVLPHVWRAVATPVVSRLFQGDLEAFKALVEASETGAAGAAVEPHAATLGRVGVA
jgi:uncharacterized membrane protein